MTLLKYNGNLTWNTFHCHLDQQINMFLTSTNEMKRSSTVLSQIFCPLNEPDAFDTQTPITKIQLMVLMVLHHSTLTSNHTH